MSSDGKKTILVVDDDETVLKTVAPVLEEVGYSVITAQTGEDGIKIAQEQKPNLILLDVMLPGMEGKEVCATLKGLESTYEIPVVFITAKNTDQDVKAEIEVGGVCHIAKPINNEELLTTVDKYVG